MSKSVVALGPETNKPSWDWVGFDVSRELSKYYEVFVFSGNAEDIQRCDLALIIKSPPRQKILKDILRKKAKIIYCPIDNYADVHDIDKDRDFLLHCHVIIVHCERLLNIFRLYCRNVEFVEHHNRFGLPALAPFRASGYAIWVGGLEHLAVVVKWLQIHRLGMELKFVTNYPSIFNSPLRDALPIPDPHEVIRWSPCNQRDAMENAKVSFDIKGTNFNQMHKPPVKAQKFIASGIPFAINPESYSAEYFANRGMILPSPLEKHYWLSREYWEETQSAGKTLRDRLTLECIGLAYKNVIDQALKLS
jgi:hypothetical protein